MDPAGTCGVLGSLYGHHTPGQPCAKGVLHKFKPQPPTAPFVSMYVRELEDSDLSDIINARGAARKCMDLVCERKGLPVGKKIVEHAEKQRTR